jgi:hypothetical protein
VPETPYRKKAKNCTSVCRHGLARGAPFTVALNETILLKIDLKDEIIILKVEIRGG